MPRSTRASRIVLLALVFLAVTAAAVPDAAAWKGSRRDEPPPGPRGDLAVVSLAAHEIAAQGAPPRYLLRVVVENRGELALTSPYQVVFRADRGDSPIGGCRGEELAQGASALCEVWSVGSIAPGTSSITASLDRGDPVLAAWDANTSNDAATSTLGSHVGDGVPLRIAHFDVLPHVLQGAGDVRFRFTVEGAHLAWIIVQSEAPRLVAGHPAEGVLDGSGKSHVKDSGPVTLVARDLSGAYVYRTVPLTNAYRPAPVDWAGDESGQDSGLGAFQVLAQGAATSGPADPIVLAGLQAYISNKRWNERGSAPLDLTGEKRRDPGTATNPASR